MRLTIAEIARALGAEPLGDTDLVGDRAGRAGPWPGRTIWRWRCRRNTPRRWRRGQARAPRWSGPAPTGRRWGLAAAILVGRPRLAMAGLTRAFDAGPGWADGIHPTALVDPAPIWPPTSGRRLCGDRRPGSGSAPGGRIGPHVTIGAGTAIGADALIHPGARIGARVHDRRPLHRAAGRGDRLGRVFLRHRRGVGGRGRARHAGRRRQAEPGAGLAPDPFSGRGRDRRRCRDRRRILRSIAARSARPGSATAPRSTTSSISATTCVIGRALPAVRRRSASPGRPRSATLSCWAARPASATTCRSATA